MRLFYADFSPHPDMVDSNELTARCRLPPGRPRFSSHCICLRASPPGVAMCRLSIGERHGGVGGGMAATCFSSRMDGKSYAIIVRIII